MTNQASKVKRNSLNKSDEDVKLEPMGKNSTDREEWRNWLASHGLPHNEVEGELILDFIEALISHREKLAYRNGYAAGNAKKNYRKKVDVETLEQLKTEITADVLAMLRKAEL